MIKQKKRSITRKSLIYTGGSVLASISMIGSTYLYSKYTSTSDYGNFQLTVSIMMLLATVGFLDIRTSTLRFMYGVSAENDEDRNKAIYSGGLIFALCTVFLVVTVFIVNKIINIPFPKIGALWAFSFALGQFYLFITRGFDKEYSYSIGYSLYFGALLVLNLYFLVVKSYGANYILLSMTIAEFIKVVYLELRIGILKKFKLKYIDKKISKHMVRFSMPLAIAALGTWIMSYYASIQISRILGSSSTGIFSMTMEFAKSVPLATAGIMLAWQEIAFSKKVNLNEKVNTTYFSSAITAFFVFFTCFFIVFVPLVQLIIPYYLSEDFQAVGTILALCTAGFTFDCIAQMVASIFGNQINSKPLMISTVMGAIFLVVTIPTFIKMYDIYGGALCVCISFALTLFIRLIWLSVGMKYKISYLKIILSLVICLIFGYYSTVSSFKINVVLLILGVSIGLPTLFKMKKLFT